MNYNQISVITSMAISLLIFLYIKWDQSFRIMKRSYIDEIERKARKADGRIADLMAQLDMQYSGELTKQVVAPSVTQMMFDLPATNSRTFKFPYTLVDPETGEVFNRFIKGRWVDWTAWQSGKQYVRRRGKDYWIDSAELSENDRVPVLRKTWDRHAQDWFYKSIWIYADEKLAGDMDTGPFILEE